MELIKAVFNDLYPTKKGMQIVFNLTRRMEKEELQGLYDTKGEVLAISWKPYKEQRSLSANSYFHVLVGKLAAKVGATNTAVKNKMIREYGQYEYVGESIPTYLVKPEFAEEIMNNPAVHFTKVGFEGDRIKLAVMRGSHTYNSAEMARLIEGTISECKEQGIETLPPEELKKMLDIWKPRKAAADE